MTRNFLLTGFVLIFSIALVGQYSFVHSNKQEPPAGHTGSPVDGKTCAKSGCHAGSAQDDNAGLIKIDVDPQNPTSIQNFSYKPNTTYQLVIKLNDLNSPIYGFQMSVLNSNQQQAGSFSVVPNNDASLQTQGGIQYYGHNPANGTSSRIVEWTAPAANKGPIKFYIAANAANDDGTNNGDDIYTTDFKVYEEGNEPTGIAGKKRGQRSIGIFPNPVQKRFTLNVDQQRNKPMQVNLLTTSGKKVSSLYKGSPKTQTFEESFAVKSDLSPGVYLVEVIQGESRSYQKLIKQ